VIKREFAAAALSPTRSWVGGDGGGQTGGGQKPWWREKERRKRGREEKVRGKMVFYRLCTQCPIFSDHENQIYL